jgi:hypothetical protein
VLLAKPRSGQQQEALRVLLLARRSVVDVRRVALVQLRMTPEGREVAYDVGSTTLVTTQRCLPILRSRTNPSFS